jgi:hypothetical protein
MKTPARPEILAIIALLVLLTVGVVFYVLFNDSAGGDGTAGSTQSGTGTTGANAKNAGASANKNAAGTDNTAAGATGDSAGKATFDPDAPAGRTPAGTRKSGIHGTGPRVTLHASNQRPASDDELKKNPAKIREVHLEIRTPLRTIGDSIRNGVTPPREISFPIFDSEDVLLTNIRYKPQNDNYAGVFIADVADADGKTTIYGHALLSYVNNALVGDIHMPDGRRILIQNEKFSPEDANAIRLTQLDPAKIPGCGTCKMHLERVRKK